MFRKFSAIILAAVLICTLLLTACGSEEKDQEQVQDNNQTNEVVQNNPETQEQDADADIPQEDQPEEEQVPVIFEDAVPEADKVYDDLRFSFTASDVSKGEWEWFNSVIASFGYDPNGEYALMLEAMKGNEDSRVMITVSFGRDSFTNPDEAWFDAGIQDTYDGNFGNFAQIRSSDVRFYDDKVVYTIDTKSLLNIYDTNSIDPDYAQLYVQFYGLTPEADAMSCDVTIEVVYPRDIDIADEAVTYAEPAFSFTREGLGKGEWDWFNCVLASYEAEYADLLAALKTENSRVTVRTDLTSADFNPETMKFSLGFQSTEDYEIVGEANSDDYELTENGLAYSISGERLLSQFEQLGINEDNSQICVNFEGVLPESDAKTINVTIEVAVPE